MSAVLQTPSHSECSELCCTDNPPVSVFVCVYWKGVPLFVGVCVCVFEKACAAECCAASRVSVGVCVVKERGSAAPQPPSSLNPLSCVVHSCHIRPIVSTDKEAQLKLNAS